MAAPWEAGTWETVWGRVWGGWDSAHGSNLWELSKAGIAQGVVWWHSGSRKRLQLHDRRRVPSLSVWELRMCPQKVRGRFACALLFVWELCLCPAMSVWSLACALLFLCGCLGCALLFVYGSLPPALR